LPSQVPPLHAVPAATGTKPQVFAAEHWPARHVFAGAGQSSGPAHSTHAPAEQTGVGPAHAGCGCQRPFLSQRAGTLPLHVDASGTHSVQWPCPSHVAPLPAAPQGVPAASGCAAQMPPSAQTASAHSFAEARQSSLFLHSTHWSPPPAKVAQNGFGAAHGVGVDDCPSAAHTAIVVSDTHVPEPGLQASHCPRAASQTLGGGQVTTFLKVRVHGVRESATARMIICDHM
jgi:hypothetical protein